MKPPSRTALTVTTTAPTTSPGNSIASSPISPPELSKLKLSPSHSRFGLKLSASTPLPTVGEVLKPKTAGKRGRKPRHTVEDEVNANGKLNPRRRRKEPRGVARAVVKKGRPKIDVREKKKRDVTEKKKRAEVKDKDGMQETVAAIDLSKHLPRLRKHKRDASGEKITSPSISGDESDRVDMEDKPKSGSKHDAMQEKTKETTIVDSSKHIPRLRNHKRDDGSDVLLGAKTAPILIDGDRAVTEMKPKNGTSKSEASFLASKSPSSINRDSTKGKTAPPRRVAEVKSKSTMSDSMPEADSMEAWAREVMATATAVEDSSKQGLRPRDVLSSDRITSSPVNGDRAVKDVKLKSAAKRIATENAVIVDSSKHIPRLRNHKRGGSDVLLGTKIRASPSGSESEGDRVDEEVKLKNTVTRDTEGKTKDVRRENAIDVVDSSKHIPRLRNHKRDASDVLLGEKATSSRSGPEGDRVDKEDKPTNAVRNSLAIRYDGAHKTAANLGDSSSHIPRLRNHKRDASDVLLGLPKASTRKARTVNALDTCTSSPRDHTTADAPALGQTDGLHSHHEREEPLQQSRVSSVDPMEVEVDAVTYDEQPRPPSVDPMEVDTEWDRQSSVIPSEGASTTSARIRQCSATPTIDAAEPDSAAKARKRAKKFAMLQEQLRAFMTPGVSNRKRVTEPFDEEWMPQPGDGVRWAIAKIKADKEQQVKARKIEQRRKDDELLSQLLAEKKLMPEEAETWKGLFGSAGSDNDDKHNEESLIRKTMVPKKHTHKVVEVRMADAPEHQKSRDAQTLELYEDSDSDEQLIKTQLKYKSSSAPTSPRKRRQQYVEVVIPSTHDRPTNWRDVYVDYSKSYK